MNNDQTSNLGYMIVRVTTARGAIPIEGALVTVTNYVESTGLGRGDVISVHKTDRSGITEKISLPTPPRSLSMSPGNGKGYTTYNVSVAKEGYYTQNYINAPVFEGITSIQSADLIPLPDNSQTDNFTTEGNLFFETENSMLESRGEESER